MSDGLGSAPHGSPCNRLWENESSPHFSWSSVKGTKCYRFPFNFLFIFIVCMCMYDGTWCKYVSVWNTCTVVHKSVDDFVKSILSLYLYVGLGDGIQVTRLAWQMPLNTDPSRRSYVSILKMELGPTKWISGLKHLLPNLKAWVPHSGSKILRLHVGGQTNSCTLSPEPPYTTWWAATPDKINK